LRLPDDAAEWLVEEGIAEHRAMRVSGGEVVEARLHWPSRLAAGWVVPARLTARSAGSARGTALTSDGAEILLDRLPPRLNEGAVCNVLVTRQSLAAPGRFKRAQGRVTNAPPKSPLLAERLRATGAQVSIVRRFPGCAWDELIDTALHGEIAFSGGALLLAATPAMTTVDIDGELAPRALALAAVPALAATLRQLDIGGSVVVDFPTLAAREDRRDVDTALDRALAGWPHERTAMNGFGLVQIVARMERPSLLQLATWSRPGLVWRTLLRRAEALDGPGRLELRINPALEAEIAPSHLAELERRSGRRVSIGTDPGLALEAPHAQLVGDD
jgi:ribonuclease G